MQNEYLAHYGVPGMKWGVRNAETLARYARDAGGRMRKKMASAAGEAFQNLKVKRANRKEAKRLAKEAGTSRKARREFIKLRKETLRAHDPDKVAKGMHTLTDMELDTKIKRLEAEEKVRKLAKTKKDNAIDTATKQENYKKAKKERRNSGFAASVAKDIGKYAATQGINVGRDLLRRNLGLDIKDKSKQGKAKDKGESVVAEVLSAMTVSDKPTPKSGLPSGDKKDKD